MRNYLKLAGIQAKAHRRSNRMTIFCIALSVFLVTGVFSMVDMAAIDQSEQAKSEHGNWHIELVDVTDKEAEQIVDDYDVENYAWSDSVNYNLDKDYSVFGKNVCITGADPSIEDIFLYHQNTEGDFPGSDGQIEITDNMRRQFGIKRGDTVQIHTPAGEFSYTVTGFLDDTRELSETDSCGIYMTRSAFSQFCLANGEEEHPELYIRFASTRGLKNTISRINDSHGWKEGEHLDENTALLMVAGASSSEYITGLYGVAALLMVLVILAGVFMISGSMNSNISERTQYFGMLRCIGAGKGQIKHLVRREALNWCVFAIPAGEAAAVAGVWIICAILHYGIGGEWACFPVFRISVTGMIIGAVIGIITVLIAADSPARRASKVSPVEAINNNNTGNIKAKAGKLGGLNDIDLSIGRNHAFSSKKRMFLITGSFALSIILFLYFSVMIDWITHALNTIKQYSQDLSVYYSGYDAMPKEFASEIGEIDGVKTACGRMYVNTEVDTSKGTTRIDLISYDDIQFRWAEDDLVSGDLDKIIEGEGVMTVFEKENLLTKGDTLNINGQTVTVEGVLSDSPFSSDGIPVIICSESLFTDITGNHGYAVIDIQVDRKKGDEAVSAIRDILPEDMKLSDVRATKQEANDTYHAFCILVYGFLGIIALITVVNIINSVSMSVSARGRQFGIMRAVGMEEKQVRRMIASEAFSYAVAGCITGCVIGLPLHYLFFRTLIGNYWGDSWSMPVVEMLIIFAVVIGSAVFASGKPAKRICGMKIIDAVYSE